MAMEEMEVDIAVDQEMEASEMVMDEVKEIGIEWEVVEIITEIVVEIGDSGQMIITEIVDGAMIVVHGIIRIQAGELAVDIIRIGQMIASEAAAINKVIQAETAMDDQCVERISVEITDLHRTTATKVSH
jgi:hypothetical protein